MKASDVLDHFRQVGTWVDWDNTCDEFLHGDPDAEVTGIATAWIPTNAAIRTVAEYLKNIFPGLPTDTVDVAYPYSVVV